MGKTKQEIADRFGRTKEWVKGFLERYGRWKRKIASGHNPKPVGRQKLCCHNPKTIMCIMRRSVFKIRRRKLKQIGRP